MVLFEAGASTSCPPSTTTGGTDDADLAQKVRKGPTLRSERETQSARKTMLEREAAATASQRRGASKSPERAWA